MGESAERHRLVVRGGLPIRTFVDLSKRLPDETVLITDHDEGDNALVLEWPADPDEDTP